MEICTVSVDCEMVMEKKSKFVQEKIFAKRLMTEKILRFDRACWS